MFSINQDLLDAGQLAGQIHQDVAALAKPDVNLLEIEKFIAREIANAGFEPAFLGYKNYPSASCLSVNSAVVHAIPSNYFLQEGDVLSIDFGVKINGWIVDTARTHAVGRVSNRIEKLIQVTKDALTEAIKVVQVGERVGDIGHCIQQIVEKNGFYIIKDLTGHGVGRELQVPPSIPNFGREGTGPVIKEGMILAIEPITALSPVKITLERDHWTIRAHPDVVCVHFEHTILVTDDGPVILTEYLPPNKHFARIRNGLTDSAKIG